MQFLPDTWQLSQATRFFFCKSYRYHFPFYLNLIDFCTNIIVSLSFTNSKKIVGRQLQRRLLTIYTLMQAKCKKIETQRVEEATGELTICKSYLRP